MNAANLQTMPLGGLSLSFHGLFCCESKPLPVPLAAAADRRIPADGPAAALEEFFAAKRAEAPPAGFMPEFLAEFHRRNGIAPAVD